MLPFILTDISISLRLRNEFSGSRREAVTDDAFCVINGQREISQDGTLLLMYWEQLTH